MVDDTYSILKILSEIKHVHDIQHNGCLPNIRAYGYATTMHGFCMFVFIMASIIKEVSMYQAPFIFNTDDKLSKSCEQA